MIKHHFFVMIKTNFFKSYEPFPTIYSHCDILSTHRETIMAHKYTTQPGKQRLFLHFTGKLMGRNRFF